MELRRVDFVGFVYPPGNTEQSTRYLRAGDMYGIELVGGFVVATKRSGDGPDKPTCRYPLSFVARMEP